MSKLFYSAKDFAAMKLRAEAAESKLNAAMEAFGEDAKAEDFNLAAAVKSLAEGKADEGDNADIKAELKAANDENARLTAELEAIRKNPQGEATTVITTTEADSGGDPKFTEAELKKFVGR